MMNKNISNKLEMLEKARDFEITADSACNSYYVKLKEMGYYACLEMETGKCGYFVQGENPYWIKVDIDELMKLKEFVEWLRGGDKKRWSGNLRSL